VCACVAYGVRGVCVCECVYGMLCVMCVVCVWCVWHVVCVFVRVCVSR
jgi:hypothetical protein